MSRSYKKHPICTDRTDGAKYWKRIANKRVRRYKGLPNYKAYKKVYCSWDIHDWISRWSKQQAINSYDKDRYFWLSGYEYDRWEDFIDKEDFLNNHWAKYYRRK